MPLCSHVLATIAKLEQMWKECQLAPQGCYEDMLSVF